MSLRLLQREEIPLIWQIDRREIVENIYHLREGRLVLEPDYFDIQGWPVQQFWKAISSVHSAIHCNSNFCTSAALIAGSD